MPDFIQEYFISPILANGWFNPVNTTIYSVILIVAVLLVYRMLKGMNVEIDDRFWIAIVPFIFWAGTTRVLHDAAFLGRLSPALNAFFSSSIFPTPGSYVLTFALALACLIASLLVQRFVDIGYWKVMFTMGTAFTLVNVTMIPFSTLFPLWLIGGVALLWACVFFSWRVMFSRIGGHISNYYHTLFSRENLAILSVHFLDATATVVALSLFGYMEQHVVPRMLFPFMGPYAMFILKAVVVLPALWAIDRYGEDGKFKKFLKIVVFILGMAPGVRNVIRLMAMV
jgi:uncharacterized membrane protein